MTEHSKIIVGGALGCPEWPFTNRQTLLVTLSDSEQEQEGP